MKPTLSKEAHKELEEILQRQFGNISIVLPVELVEDLGLTLLKTSVILIKKKIKLNKSGAL